MSATDEPAPTLVRHLPPPGETVSADALLERFLAYLEEAGIRPYPAQEEAILELMGGSNVILNTPTGSGKSLVALAACFKALADNQSAFYTAPIKALVTEKFFELCAVLGAEHVGLMTGDATINRSAPVICCTAEILSNMALRQGAAADVHWVVMDEFHYYSDRDRGVAWQVPLITLPQARFLLMSATLGATDFFEAELSRRTGAPTALVRSTDRPVPLDWEYRETPLLHTLDDLLKSGRVPVYIVHFSQRAASEQAQALMSLDVLDKEEKKALKEALAGFRFDSPFGKELARFIPHGIGVHHAGMLPKYRRLVERLARRGLLRIICGTDTLGVGVNVPIRTVLFTQLCKFDGAHTAILSVRDFHQIAGRAGRKGFDSRGSVVVQAPEHEIENLELKKKAAADPKKAKKLRPRKPPEFGYKAWNRETFDRLVASPPEPLVSRFQVSHGMLLQVLSRGAESCGAARALLRDCHEGKPSKRRLRKTGIEMIRSLVAAKIVELTPDGVFVSEELQENFSLNQALSVFAVELFDTLDPAADDYHLVLVSIVESILEDPAPVLRQQLAKLKTEKIAELKAAGVEYDDRMEELAKLEHPKPEAELILAAFEIFAKAHPWVAGSAVSPKSVVREMYETAASFHGYVREYGLARAEGVLLRYLTDAYRTLQQAVPEKLKTDAVVELIEWLGGELRSVDASLLEEWEALADGAPKARPAADAEPTRADITRDWRGFVALVRTACFRLLQALARRDGARLLGALQELAVDPERLPRDSLDTLWTEARLAAAVEPYFAEYEAVRVDAEARSPKRVHIDEAHPRRWHVRQTISDPEEHDEWGLELLVDLDACRDEGRLVLTLERIGAGGGLGDAPAGGGPGDAPAGGGLTD